MPSILRRLLPLFLAVILLPAFASASVVDLPRTGQGVSFVPKDDGELRTGLAWPSPRFVVSGDTITDKLTGLMWLKDAGVVETCGFVPPLNPDDTKYGVGSWKSAMDFITMLNVGKYASYNAGYRDWRLPNVLEMESVISLGSSFVPFMQSVGFVNSKPKAYVTSTTTPHDPAGNYYVNGVCGKIVATLKTTGQNYVLPVRGVSGGTAALWRTGQSTSYAANDDGALITGAPWPEPRFADNMDGTVTDNLTGLMWMQDAGTPSVGSCQGGPKTFEEGIQYAACLNSQRYLGYTDWRIANRKEMISLMDFSQHSPILPPGHPFVNVRHGTSTSTFYWTSSTLSTRTEPISQGWVVNMKNGETYWMQKDPGRTMYVWPVRGSITGPYTPPPAPRSAVTSPKAGAYLGKLASYTIKGNASGGNGGIAKVDVSTDDGKTWAAASDSSGGNWSSWSFQWQPVQPGTYTIKSKATDKSAKVETPGAGIKVYAGLFRVTTHASPEGGGTVTLGSAGPYPEGSTVTATAVPAKHYLFTGWAGDATGTEEAAATLTMDRDFDITANFFSPRYNLTAGANPPEGGSVSVSPKGPYRIGDVVTLTAAPAPEYVFKKWAGNVEEAEAPRTTMTMNADEVVSANFRKKNGLDLGVEQAGAQLKLTATLSLDGSPEGREIRFYVSRKAGTWRVAARKTTGAGGVCTHALKLPKGGASRVRAAYEPPQGERFETPELAVNCVPVKLLSPPNRTVTTERAPAASWQPCPEAIGYIIQAGDRGFKSVFAQAAVESVTTSGRLPELARGAQYWRVVPVLPYGMGLPSGVFAITYKEPLRLEGLTVDETMAGVTARVTAMGESGPAAGLTIRFVCVSAGRTSALGTAKTDNMGVASMAKPRKMKPGNYAVRALFKGDKNYDKAQSQDSEVVVQAWQAGALP